jgi:hypothetical protein
MKKRTCLALPVFALVIGFGFTGCDTPTGEEKDSWTEVRSVDQLDGIWDGAYSEETTVKDLDDDDWGEMKLMFGDIPVNIIAEITINADAKPQTVAMKMTLVFSFASITDLEEWEVIKLLFEPLMGKTDNKNHSITMTSSPDDMPISELSNADWQINQNSTKMKIPADSLGEGSPELTLAKR